MDRINIEAGCLASPLRRIYTTIYRQCFFSATIKARALCAALPTFAHAQIRCIMSVSSRYRSGHVMSHQFGQQTQWSVHGWQQVLRVAGPDQKIATKKVRTVAILASEWLSAFCPNSNLAAEFMQSCAEQSLFCWGRACKVRACSSMFLLSFYQVVPFCRVNSRCWFLTSARWSPQPGLNAYIYDYSHL